MRRRRFVLVVLKTAPLLPDLEAFADQVLIAATMPVVNIEDESESTSIVGVLSFFLLRLQTTISLCSPFFGSNRISPVIHDNDLRTLSMGAAQTALEEWLQTLSGIVQQGEHLPEVLSVRTGTGHNFYPGLADSFISHDKKISAPFRESDNAGWFVASREDVVSWVNSRVTCSSFIE